MPIKNFSTDIPEGRTVGEIMGLLATKGARSIHIEYDESGRPASISFVVMIKAASGSDGVPVPFRLPCNFEGVFRAIASGYADQYARRRYERNPRSKEQSRRIAWRIVKDWVAAQMAMVEADCAALAQVFLPYATSHSESGKEITVYDKFLLQVSQQKQLASKVGDSLASKQ